MVAGSPSKRAVRWRQAARAPARLRRWLAICSKAEPGPKPPAETRSHGAGERQQVQHCPRRTVSPRQHPQVGTDRYPLDRNVRRLDQPSVAPPPPITAEPAALPQCSRNLIEILREPCGVSDWAEAWFDKGSALIGCFYDHHLVAASNLTHRRFGDDRIGVVPIRSSADEATDQQWRQRRPNGPCEHRSGGNGGRGYEHCLDQRL